MCLWENSLAPFDLNVDSFTHIYQVTAMYQAPSCVLDINQEEGMALFLHLKNEWAELDDA